MIATVLALAAAVPLAWALLAYGRRTGDLATDLEERNR